MIATTVTILAGCASRPTATKDDASLLVRPDTTAPVTANGFTASLIEVGLSARRAFPGGTRQIGHAATITIDIALTGEGVHRLYRPRGTSGLISVQDMGGRELLPPGSGPRPFMSLPTEFMPLAGGAGLPNRPIQPYKFAFGTTEIPTEIRRVAGEIVLDVVADEDSITFPLPVMESPTELAHGLVATLKLVQLNESGSPVQMILEITSPISRDQPDPATPEIFSVELTDPKGNHVAMLQRREEYAVGNIMRRRFALDHMSQMRHNRNQSIGPVESVRLRVFSRIETVRVPFVWGPFSLTPPPGQSYN